jgi:hypothetical protein
VRQVQNAYRVLVVLMGRQPVVAALIVAPTLFYAQPDRQLAGQLAGHIFSIETYLGIAVAAAGLLLPGRTKMGLPIWRRRCSRQRMGAAAADGQARLHGASYGLELRRLARRVVRCYTWSPACGAGISLEE